MRSRWTTLVIGLGTFAGVAAAQVPQRLPPAVTVDTVSGLTVQNERNVPVTVFMEYGRFDRRLGVVPPATTGTLPLPGWAVRGHTQIRLFARPEGELDDLATQQFALQSPPRLTLRVPPRGGPPVTATDVMMEAIPPEELAEATVTVDNSRTEALTVYARQAPFDVRLGQVPPHGRVTLRFPKSVLHQGATVRIFVHPDGGADLASQQLQVSRGDHLGIRIPPR